MTPVSLRWQGDASGHLELIDQTLLPGRLEWIACRDVPTLIEAIKSLRVRGAPAIGIAGGYGLVVAAGEAVAAGMPPAQARAHVLARAEQLATARPTAVNLRWAVERCLRPVAQLPDTSSAVTLATTLFAEAREVHDEDRRLCAAIGRHGAAVLPEGGVLTHCNTVTVLCDSAAAHLLKTGRVAACIVGADRITANGDTANKIGTYGLAILAAAHGVPFYVAAPSSTFDLSLATGDEIPIEERAAAEVTRPLGVIAAPEAALAFNPAFDVTPARLIRGIVTEHGVIEPVTPERIRDILGR